MISNDQQYRAIQTPTTVHITKTFEREYRGETFADSTSNFKRPAIVNNINLYVWSPDRDEGRPALAPGHYIGNVQSRHVPRACLKHTTV